MDHWNINYEEVMRWTVARRRRALKYKSVLTKKINDSRKQQNTSTLLSFNADDQIDIWGDALPRGEWPSW